MDPSPYDLSKHQAWRSSLSPPRRTRRRRDRHLKPGLSPGLVRSIAGILLALSGTAAALYAVHLHHSIPLDLPRQQRS